MAHYERGETHRLRGDYNAAEAAYARPPSTVIRPSPGCALLWLARDRPAAATAAVRRLLAERQDPVRRSQVLAAAVEVLVAAGDAEDAAPLGEELCRIGETFGCTALQAAGQYAVAVAELARDAAEPALRAAVERASLVAAVRSVRGRAEPDAGRHGRCGYSVTRNRRWPT